MGNKYIKSRRSNHEGSIVKRSSGLYQAMIMFDGKRQYHYDRKKQNCVSWLAEMHLKFIRGQPITDNSISLIKWLYHYIDTYCDGYCRPSTLANYRLYTNGHIARSCIADTPVSKLTCDHIQVFMNNVERLDGNGKLS